MNNSKAAVSLSRQVSRRQAISEYLAELPLLDSRVLFCRFARGMSPETIATEMLISPNHVKHILNRVESFRSGLADHAILSAFPVWTKSSIAAF